MGDERLAYAVVEYGTFTFILPSSRLHYGL